MARYRHLEIFRKNAAGTYTVVNATTLNDVFVYVVYVKDDGSNDAAVDIQDPDGNSEFTVTCLAGSKVPAVVSIPGGFLIDNGLKVVVAGATADIFVGYRVSPRSAGG